jgi:hypothetical protein
MFGKLPFYKKVADYPNRIKKKVCSYANAMRSPREYGDPPSLHELWRTGRRVVRLNLSEIDIMAGRGGLGRV